MSMVQTRRHFLIAMSGAGAAGVFRAPGVLGPPHWQIEAFQTFTIPEELAAQHGYRS
jgi:hypothetical protein